MREKKLVYIADLTHTGQTIALNAMPYAVACLVSYAKTHLANPDDFEFKIFKYPEKLIEAVLEKTPDIAAFSNYMWNIDLGTSIAKKIKERNPDVIVIFGGPNYPTNETEQKIFLEERPIIDFHIYKEGELAFTELLNMLHADNFNVGNVKEKTPPGSHFLRGGLLVSGSPLDRVKNLDNIPSPYLTGLLDEFFDDNLVPVLQCNRGCPFSCTFCVEGLEYYTKVNKKSPDLVREELLYMASRKKSGTHDLHWVDSNAGMYKDDEEISRYIAETQEKFNWPEYIHVSTGKNQKDRILRVARTIHGALRLSGALQSQDPEVLKNIKRGNINTETQTELAHEGKEMGSNVYSELIVALPGETKESHFETIKKTVNAKFQVIRTYNLMMLPGVEMSELPTRAEFDMKTGFRIMPRCFGEYKFGKEEPILSSEIEEICFQTKDMSFEDYLECRALHLTNEIFFNDSMVAELVEFLTLYDISIFSWLELIHSKRHKLPEKLKNIYDEFLRETKEELWQSKSELEKFVKDKQTIQKYISGELGSNLLFKYKALALTEALQEVLAVAYSAAKALIKQKHWDVMIKYENYLDELQIYSLLRKIMIFSADTEVECEFGFDFEKLEKSLFKMKPSGLEKFLKPVKFLFFRNPKNKKLIADALSKYGDNLVGYSRILSKFNVTKMYREITKAPK